MNRNQISIHAPRVGSDINGSVRLVGSPNFNPRSPCGERRGQTDHQYNGRKISIHAPRVGSDSARSTQQEAGQKFQSTLPVWGATCTFSEPGSDIYLISIHAPRVGSDVHCYNQAAGRTDFNPRSPCGERRHCCGVGIGAYHFNPRSPCGERLGDRPMRTLDAISIHAPRVGSDFGGNAPMPGGIGFQSTLPVWGATYNMATQANGLSNFNPRSPCGERHPFFIPAPPCKGDFNPRSPCGERRELHGLAKFNKDFNPRSPCGERRPRRNIPLNTSHFNPRSPCGERRGTDCCKAIWPHFNPRSPCGERREIAWEAGRDSKFQSTLPVWGATAADDF